MRNPKIEFDKLQMYFGEPYVIDFPDVKGVITIYQPTIGDVVALGESIFNATLRIFTTNTTANRLELWKSGLDWNIVSDFELFCMLYRSINNKASKLIFKDLDFSLFKVLPRDVNGETVIYLYDEEHDIEINENVYHHISQYLRNVFNTFPEEKITTDEIMKKWFIRKDERQLEIDKNKKDEDVDKNSIQPLISACVNHPGFKYKLSELKNVGICEFYDSVQRLQVYENTTSLMKGMYSGMIDSKKIRPEDYNFMKKI